MREKFELPQVKLLVSEHFIDRWHEHIALERPSKIRALVRSAILQKTIYGRSDGYFEIFVSNTKAILRLTEAGWIAVTVLSPDCAEMILHRAGMDELARKQGRRLAHETGQI